MKKTSKEQTSRELLMRGFEHLIREASSTRGIPGFSCINLKEHPFGLSVPELKTEFRTYSTNHIRYVGYPGATDCSVQGIIRLVAWALGNDCLGSNRGACFLRVIYAESNPDNPSHHNVYYEIRVDDELFMAGGCTDCSGAGGTGKDAMDSVMAFLSKVYGLPIEEVYVPYAEAYEAYSHIQDLIWAEHQEYAECIKEREAEEAKRFHFREGQMVKFSEKGKEYSSYSSRLRHGEISEGQTFLVTRVETFQNKCTCGLGDKTPLYLHPEIRCALRARLEAEHHQLICILIGEEEVRFSGSYLEPVE